MIPIVARTTEEMLRLVPNSYREASIALGATKARTILRVVIPAATGEHRHRRDARDRPRRRRDRPAAVHGAGQPAADVRPEPAVPLADRADLRLTRPARTRSRSELAWAGILVLISLIFVLNVMIRLVAARRSGR